MVEAIVLVIGNYEVRLDPRLRKSCRGSDHFGLIGDCKEPTYQLIEEFVYVITIITSAIACPLS